MASHQAEPAKEVSAHSHDLLKNIANSVNASQVSDLIKELKSDALRQIASDVVQHLCKLLDDTAFDDQKTIAAAEKVFIHIATTLGQKESLILFVEQAREHWTDGKFHALLLPVMRIVLQLKAPAGQSLAFVLDAFTEFIVTLPLPKPQLDLEKKDKLLLDIDPSVRRVCGNVPRFISYIQPFVKRVSWSTVSRSAVNADVEKQITALSQCVLTILGRPLGHLDLSSLPNHSKSTVRVCAERCVRLIGKLHPDFVCLYVSQQEVINSSRELNMQKLFGLSTFGFLVFSENILPDHIPSVYSNYFLLEINALAISNLLEQTELLPKLHGVQLCINLLGNIDQGSLPADVVESEDMRRVVQAVVKAAVTAKTKELTSSLQRVLILTCGTLEPVGKLQYLYAMLRIAPRSCGVVACVVGMLANEIVATIDKGDCKVFAGSGLERLLQLVFSLPNGEKTDLLDNSERIMAAMKLLRVVLPRDKAKDNITGIWNMLPTIEAKYFRLLFAGIELSCSHYQLEIRKLKELRRGEPTGREFVSHGTPVELSKYQQLGVMETALQTFSMMEDVAKQTVELIKTERALWHNE